MAEASQNRPLFADLGPVGGPFDRSSYPATPVETRVATLIWSRRGRGSPISINDICRLTNLKTREVKDVVEGLRMDHRMRIGALRTSPGGYFIVETAEDAEAALRPYRKQVFTMLKVIAVLADKQQRMEFAGQLRIAWKEADEREHA